MMRQLLLLCLLLVSANAFHVNNGLGRKFEIGSIRSLATRKQAVGTKTSVSSLRWSPSTPSKTALSMVGPDADARLRRKLANRRKRVLYGYRINTFAFAFLSVFALVKHGVSPFNLYAISGPLMASVVSYKLAGAVTSDNLASDTYKRLNLMLVIFGLGGLGMGATVPQANNPFWGLWMIISFISMVNSIKGYGYGLKGWELKNDINPVVDMAEGLVRSFLVLVSFPNTFTTLGYMASYGFVVGLKLSKLWEVLTLMVAGARPTILAARIARFVQLLLLSTVVFSLKDAEDRDRLGGTTFIEFNFVSSVTFATMAAFYSLRGGKFSAPPLAVAATVCSIFTGLTGVKLAQAKRRKASSKNLA